METCAAPNPPSVPMPPTLTLISSMVSATGALRTKNALVLTVLSCTLMPSCVILVSLPRSPWTNASPPVTAVVLGVLMPANVFTRSSGLRVGRGMESSWALSTVFFNSADSDCRAVCSACTTISEPVLAISSFTLMWAVCETSTRILATSVLEKPLGSTNTVYVLFGRLVKV